MKSHSIAFKAKYLSLSSVLLLPALSPSLSFAMFKHVEDAGDSNRVSRASASRSTDAQNAAIKAAQKTAMKPVVSGIHSLGTSIGKQLAKSGKGFVLSPISIGTAWTMATMGASDLAMPEMLSVFDEVSPGNGSGSRRSPMTLEVLTRGAGALHSSLSREASASIISANSVWVSDRLGLNVNYKTQVQEQFQAEVGQVDFGQSSAAKTMNDWASANTQNLIRDLIPRTNSADLAYIINTVLYQVEWMNAFNKVNGELNFNTSTSETIDVPAMQRKAQYHYFFNDFVHGVSIETKDGQSVVDLILPREELFGSDLGDLINLNALTELTTHWRPMTMNVIVPTLDLEYTADLIPNFNDLGVNQVFMPGFANLEKMISGQSLISLIRHKVVLKMDEKGVKAAAATAIGASRSIAMPVNDLVFNRPFFVSIRYHVTPDSPGTVAFFAHVSNPTFKETNEKN